MSATAAPALPALRSPVSGQPLQPDGPHSLRAGDERWPVLDGIPFLRVGRDALRLEALARIDAGDPRGATVALLGDQDDWASAIPAPDPVRVAEVVDAANELSLREAMDGLGFGPVGAYFAYRWSDPTFLSGLALLDLHARRTRSAFELACGIGHFGRELALRDIAYTGGDVVWAKLWVARRWVVPQARLVCFDAGAPFPVGGPFDLALCHDALHYLPDPAHAVAELRRLAPTVAVGHAHNARVENLSPGAPLGVASYAALLPGGRLYDDRELADGLVAGTPAPPRDLEALGDAAAVGVVLERPGPGDSADAGADPAGEEGHPYALPPAGRALRLNPLLAPPEGAAELDPVPLRPRWPSARYEQEYAADSGYLLGDDAVPRAVLQAAAGGAVRTEAAVDRLARRRVLLDLPERW